MNVTAQNLIQQANLNKETALISEVFELITGKAEEHVVLECLEQAAEAGDIEAQYSLGRIHLMLSKPINERLFNELCSSHLCDMANRGLLCKTIDELVAWFCITYCSNMSTTYNQAIAYNWLVKAVKHKHQESFELLMLISRYGFDLSAVDLEITGQIAEQCFQRAVACFDSDEPDYKRGMDYLWAAIKLDHLKAKQRWENAFLQLTYPEFMGAENENTCFEFAYNWCEKRLAKVPGDYEVNFALAILLMSGKGTHANPARAKDLFDKIHSGVGMQETYSWTQGLDIHSELASFWLARTENWQNGIYPDEKVASFFASNKQSQKKQVDTNLIIPALKLDFCIEFNDTVLLASILRHTKDRCFDQLSMQDKLGDALENVLQQKCRAENAEHALEETMAMFAHKFRSPLDTIIYNTNHEHQPKLYIQAAQTMRGLLDIFSIISSDENVLVARLKSDNQGDSDLLKVFSKTLDMILLHLLSAQAAEKIQQHYMRYAKKHGLCDAELSYKQWNDDYFELERQLQTQWEQSFAELLSQQAPLEQRLAWLEERFFKLELQGFEQANIQFKEYGITESFLTILLNEVLINAFKYYSSDTQQSVVVAWSEDDNYQVLTCRNPSARNERDRPKKGSGKGHTFLSALARKTSSQFTKPKPQDDFVLEFGIANQLLISN